MKLKVEYTLTGWIDIEVPNDLDENEIYNYVEKYIRKKVSDQELINGLNVRSANDIWSFGMDEDQIRIEEIEDTDYNVLYSRLEDENNN